MTSTAKSNHEFFLKADLGQYTGEWVAICANRVVAHGNDVKQVAEEAQRLCGSRKFLLAHIPSNETMIF